MLPSLSALLADISLAPAVVLTIRDTQPKDNPEAWLSAVDQLSLCLHANAARRKLSAASEMQATMQALRLKVLNDLPPFLLSLIRPLRSASKGLSTNLAVLQTSLLLKYERFYRFLSDQEPRLAQEVQRGYANAARSYYETAFRRYTRTLALILTRPHNGNPSGVSSRRGKQWLDRDVFDQDDSTEPVVLAYMADNRDFVSLLLAFIARTNCARRFQSRLFSDRFCWFFSTIRQPNSPSWSDSSRKATATLLVRIRTQDLLETCLSACRRLIIPKRSKMLLQSIWKQPSICGSRFSIQPCRLAIIFSTTFSA